MKKNLFLLFSIYFFVLQPLVAGLLRGQANFFRLGAINLLAIVLIGLVYNTVEAKSAVEEKPEHEKKATPMKEPKVSYHEHFHVPVKDHKKKSELFFPAFISFVITIAIFLLFPSNAMAMVTLISLSVGFLVFVFFTSIFRHHFSKGFWKLGATKVYIVLLTGSLLFAAYDYYVVYHNYDASFQDYIAQNIFGEERIPTDGYVFTGQGTILASGENDIISSGTIDDASGSDVATDIFSGMIKEETGTVLGTSGDTPTPTVSPTTSANVTTTIGKQKLMDAIVYVVKKYELPVVSKKDISFSYVSFKNPYYNEWRTAYANNLIGKSTNPSKYIICDTYIVMKGLVEKRDVSYTSANVISKFRAEAIKRDALNGCIKGKIVTDKNL